MNKKRAVGIIMAIILLLGLYSCSTNYGIFNVLKNDKKVVDEIKKEGKKDNTENKKEKTDDKKSEEKKEDKDTNKDKNPESSNIDSSDNNYYGDSKLHPIYRQHQYVETVYCPNRNNSVKNDKPQIKPIEKVEENKPEVKPEEKPDTKPENPPVVEERFYEKELKFFEDAFEKMEEGIYSNES